ncbi:hypothetical protein LJR219_000374 [Phenylobacterium sp. LjRoot219]|uniref:hypothetical protein n=1 Tax=Phenylobacterium sp. LjRoot219 TaxID=3342283 RepID=UPI003ECF2836
MRRAARLSEMRRRAFSPPLLLLATVAAYAAVRLADPQQRWAAIPVGGDRVEHAVVAYLLVMFSFVGLPRLPLWAPAAGLIAFGVLIEAAQALPGVVGSPQPGDVVANAVGALAATLPAWLARRRYEAA